MDSTESSTSGYGIFMTFLGGLAVGYGAALLFAPRSGRETRAILSDYAQSTVSSAKGAAQAAGQKVNEFVEDGKDRVRNVQARASTAGKSAMDEIQKTTRGSEVHQ